MAYWWVNQKQSYRAEREGGFIWAPLLDVRGYSLSHWEAMTQVRPGDVVFHHARGIRALGTVATAAVPSPMPPELPKMWERDGRLIRVDYADIAQPIMADEIPEARRIAERGPFASTGRVNQGYLYPLSDRFARWLLITFGSRIGPMAADSVHAGAPAPESERKPILPADPELRRRIENYAVDVAFADLAAEYGSGRVQKMPANNPGFDIEVNRTPMDSLHVEVKGTQRFAPVFLMSENERVHSVHHAAHYELRVVWGIDLETQTHVGVERRAGEVRANTHGLVVQRWQGRLTRSHPGG